MTSGLGGINMAFASFSEFATFRAKSLFSASTTVVGALNQLASNIAGATSTIFTGSIAAQKDIDAAVTLSKVAGDNSVLSPECGIEKCEVFVNGQLLVSSSIGATNDYAITANDTLKFKFVLQPGDMVMALDRS
jgi:hypothetical protein